MEEVLRRINGFVWGVPALVLILGVGLYLSWKTGFAQLRLLPRALKKLWTMIRGRGEDNSFKALCTALAATVGTGNIAGVAGAIALGGPGSIFWMWICALLGMVTKYAEAVLAVRFRHRTGSGEVLAGPMYIIEKGLGRKYRWLGVCYCFFGCLAAFGMGNATQINAVTQSAASAASYLGREFPEWAGILLGVSLGLLAAWSLLGGAKRITALASMLVPVASAAYILLSLGAIAWNAAKIPSALESILVGAFQPRAVTGGLLGSAFSALRIGASRGVFTNEAGMGTASIAHGTADGVHPAEQGLMGIMEVFLDTVVICTLTALVILTGGVSIQYGTDAGAILTTQAFAATYGPWVSVPIALFLTAFGFATMLGWGFYGLRCAQYLFGENAWKPFTVLMVLGGLAGVVLNTGPVWMLSETVNGLMAIPNLIALAALSPQVVSITNSYQKRAPEGAQLGKSSDRGRETVSPPV